MPPGALRIAFTAESILGGSIDKDCADAVKYAAGLCEELGHQITEEPLRWDSEAFAKAFLTIAATELRTDVAGWEKRTGRRARFGEFEPETWAVCLLGRTVRASEFSAAVRYLHRCSRELAGLFGKYDLLLTPTLSRPPLEIGELRQKGSEAFATRLLGRVNAGRILGWLGRVTAVAGRIFEFCPFTPLFNATGQPAMSVPLYWNSEGLPLGVQFVGRYSDEATLFRLAGQLEEARPWFEKRPPIYASSF
jgi:amidase